MAIGGHNVKVIFPKAIGTEYNVSPVGRPTRVFVVPLFRCQLFGLTAFRVYGEYVKRSMVHGSINDSIESRPGGGGIIVAFKSEPPTIAIG